MKKRMIVVAALVAATGLAGCFPRHGHGPNFGHGGWNNGNWNGGGWNGGGWNGGGWDDDDDDWDGWDNDDWDDDDGDRHRGDNRCHPFNNFCGSKPGW